MSIKSKDYGIYVETKQLYENTDHESKEVQIKYEEL